MINGGKFQLIMLIAFIMAAVFGILVFSGLIPIGNKDKTVVTGSVVLWGTMKSSDLIGAFDEFSIANPTLTVKYVQKNPATFDQDLLEALATGVGPDMFILPDDLIVHYRKRIMPIPYTSFSQASFHSSFASAGDIYLDSDGIIALPLAIDPMIMYYNRSIFDANNIVSPPVYWDDLNTLLPILTKKDENNKIINSALAMGQFANVTHAKDIISMLFMQAGNPIVTEKDGIFSSTLSGNASVSSASLGPILSYYTSFADPLSPSYSWNKSLPKSRDAFGSEKLAIYFGFASELSDLTAKNPNQNFYLAPVPEIKNANFKLTFGHTYALAISAYTKNTAAAFQVSSILATSNFAQKFANALFIAPARRDLLAAKPVDAYFPVIYSSALFANTWFDPSPADTDTIFQRMVENVLSNNLSADNAISDASSKLELLLSK